MIRKKAGKTNLIVIISLILIIIINFAISLAYFTDKSEYNSGVLQFGTIALSANNDGWFSSTENYYGQVKPGDEILVEDVKFNLATDSEAMYVRVKYLVSSDTENSETLKVYNYLKDRTLTLTTGSDYSWSDKRGDYYYLMNADGSSPLAVSEARSTDYTFLTTANSKISETLEYNGELAESDPINISITIEAVQVAHVNGTIDNIESVLNSIMSN